MPYERQSLFVPSAKVSILKALFVAIISQKDQYCMGFKFSPACLTQCIFGELLLSLPLGFCHFLPSKLLTSFANGTICLQNPPLKSFFFVIKL
jgi:hypothetical protein